MKFELICVLFTSCFTFATALSCYNCLYFNGHYLSNPQCQNNPSSIPADVCPLTSVSTLSTVKGHYQPNDTTIFSMDEIELKQVNYITMCAKFTGILDAKPITLRSCGYGSRTIDGVCGRDATLQLDGRYATDVVGCFCSIDRCNGVSGGASNLQFTYFSLFAIVIHSMHKLVSVENFFLRY